MPRVLLVVPPFHQAFIPALGVSLLKAALIRADIPCDVLYLNVRFAERIGPELYTEIASEGRIQALAGEWVFAGDLFGDRAPDPRGFLEEVLLGRYGDVYGRAFTDRLEALRAQVPAFLDEVMDEVAWDRYALVGVSSTFQQNCAGLALLRRLNARHPEIRTAMGGANCEGQMGAAIHRLFTFVDYVCSGEADEIFPSLVKAILTGQRVGGLPGIFARGEQNPLGEEAHAPLVLNMDLLPYPDYGDYFAQFRASTLVSIDSPTMAFETSRGCWWGQKHHCTFCGLNGGGMQYRSKSPQHALDELDFLMDHHGVRKVYAVDNILDLKYLDTVVAELAGRSRPPQLFYETKANLTKRQLRLMARAGVWGIQPGIESLGTHILHLMDKGVTALQNVRLLKWCAEIGLVPEWNFLCGFPGENPEDYASMADLVPSLTHLYPPGGPGRIRLDRFSPYFTAPDVHGMIDVRASIAYRYIYPFQLADLDRLAYYFDYEYADGRDPDQYTAALKEAITAWREHHRTARLELRVTDDRLEIEDTRPVAVRHMTMLHGPARLAYLALDAGKTVESLRAELSHGEAGPDTEQIQEWLDEWERARLVMREGPRYLSLATNFAERVQLPVERFLAALAGSTSGRD
jgi:ribosomal peptide maturation radical SAM protein 1